jgi:hypothetical protein
MTAVLRQAARKLRGRSFDEIRVRLFQMSSAFAERMGWPPSGLQADAEGVFRHLTRGAPRDPDALLAAFRARGADGFGAFADPAGTVAALRRRCPSDEVEVLARAAAVRARRFDLMGYRGLDYGDPVDWQLDPVSDRRASLIHWSRVPYLDPYVVGDHKLVWELSRQQYLVVLGQAYWYTGNEAYAEDFAALVTSWLDGNPPKRGMNWTSSLEVAFRAMSWLWALRFFKHAPALTSGLYARMLGGLAVHARHLETYLSTYFSPNTHLTGEALGLVFIGTWAPELASAERWRSLGERILLGQLARQVRSDGIYFEQATQYHRYTTEFYLQLLLLTCSTDRPVDGRLAVDAQRLVEALAQFCGPDGRMPLLGDDDGGRLIQLDGRAPDDLRGLLTLAAVVFERQDWAWLGRGDEAASLWLLGPTAGARLDALPRRAPGGRSHAFRESGFFVLRDGWNEQSSHAVFDCGPHGVFNCGHAHADVLGLVLSVRGRPLFVDAGTYVYPGHDRNAFRGGEAHNAITIDGRGSSEPGAGWFQWARIAHSELSAWATGDWFDVVEGTHDGFTRQGLDAEHIRQVTHLAGCAWVVRDRVRASEGRRITLRWHLPPGYVVECPGAQGEATRVVMVRDFLGTLIARLLLVVPASADLRVEESWVSLQYGARSPAPVLTIEVEASGHDDLLTVALPATDGRAADVRSLDCDGGRAWVISEPSGADNPQGCMLLVGSGGSPLQATWNSVAVETDAELAWLEAGPTTSRALLVRGATLRVAQVDALMGLTELNVPIADRWAAGERTAGGWRWTSGRLDPSQARPVHDNEQD